MKDKELRKKLQELRVGEPLRLIADTPDESLEVERIMVGMEEGWAVYHRGERMIMQDQEETVRYLAKYWNINIKKVMDMRYSELGEIIDLGDY
ncbi:MAG: hypothetical protein WBZ33_08440 [Thermoactinomyces sp.]|jgi:hypothetical protein